MAKLLLMTYRLMGFLSCLFLFASCSGDIAKTAATKPSAMGVMNEIVAIADEEDWNTMIGDTFQYYFASAFPIMPQPEPFFDIRHFTLEEIKGEPLRQQLRTYVVLCNLNDDESAITRMVRNDLGEERFVKARKDGELQTSVGKDKWARNQIVIYLFGRSEDELVENIKNSFSAVAKRINIHDSDQLQARVYAKNVNLGLQRDLKENYDFNLDIPSDYKFVMSKDNYSWYRKDTKEATMSLVFKKVNYLEKEDLSKTNLVDMANAFGQLVDKNDPDNFLRLDDKHLPILDYDREIDGNYVKEIRGIWEMSKDFTGGPYISYLIHDKEKNTLLNVFAFVHAPGAKKRDYVQQLDYLVKKITF